MRKSRVRKKYVSVDIEASGPTPGKYSMLSFGACIVGEEEKTFYRELKPISRNYNEEAMRVGCLGLKCLEGLGPEYDPESESFDPELVLDELEEKGTAPEQAMKEFREWVLKETDGHRPIIAAAPIVFDGMYISWYFDNAGAENPFGYSGEDMNSFYRGLVRDEEAHMKDARVRDERDPAHNSLEDAIYQARIFEKVLEKAKGRRRRY